MQPSIRGRRGPPVRFRVRPLLGALAAAGCLGTLGAQAATIPVTTGGDAGNAGTCTLRQAVESLNAASVVGGCANSSADPFGTNDRVDLTGRTGTITLAGTELTVATSMVFEGPGATQLTISGGNASRVINGGSVYGLQLDIARVTIANGRANGPGGCIFALQAEVEIEEAVITGCQALHDPTFGLPVLNGMGGGVFALEVQLDQSTVSGNTAQTAGGGVFGNFVFANRSAITGNTVTGHNCTFDPDGDPGEQKYCISAIFGGGGAVGASNVVLVDTTVSGNTVNASTLSDGSDSYRIGFGGGISSVSKYTYDPDDLLAAGKSTVAGTRALFGRPGPATAARARTNAVAHAKFFAQRAGKPRAKADGYGADRFGMVNSTLSGNRIVGGGPPATLVAKYGGAGAAFFSQTENAEIANSTVSGNSLPLGGNCSNSGAPPLTLACGAGLSGDSFELTNSTVTGNVGWSAVQQFKYDSGPPGMVASGAKAAKALARLPKLQSLHARWTRSQAGLAPKRAVAKASSPPIFDSTIVAGNAGTYDVACIDDCTISGANNLVRTRTSTVSFVNAPINANPELAPLANNGGTVAGAPGALGTGPVRTHALYIGSPAIDAGSNIEGFSYDQRGPGFPRQTGAGVDIGAFEGAIAAPGSVPVPGLGPAGLALLASMLAFSAAYLRRRRTT